VFLNVSFGFDNTDALDVSEVLKRVGLLVWRGDISPTENEAIFENCDEILTDVEFDESIQMLRVKSTGIPAKKMGDTMAFRAYYELNDGTYIYSRLVTEYSPKKYCYSRISKGSADEKALMIAILNYGAAAQMYFAYNTDRLMNADLSDEHRQLVWDASLVRTDWSIAAAKEGKYVRNKTVVTRRSANLTLEGAIDYNFAIGVSENVSVQNVEILIWTEDTYNNADTLSRENATHIQPMQYDSDENLYSYKHKGLPAKAMFSAVYACAIITDADGNEYYSGVIVYCPERYAAINMESTKEATANLAKRMVIYGDAAKTYFENK